MSAASFSHSPRASELDVVWSASRSSPYGNRSVWWSCHRCSRGSNASATTIADAAGDVEAVRDERGGEAGEHEHERRRRGRSSQMRASFDPLGVVEDARDVTAGPRPLDHARLLERERCRHQRREEDRQREEAGQRERRLRGRGERASQPPCLDHPRQELARARLRRAREDLARAGPPRGSRRRRGSTPCRRPPARTTSRGWR